MNYEEKIKITCKHGFIYDIMVKHNPYLGFSTALYNDQIIDTVEYGKLHEPLSDDDAEWERYEELFAEWSDMAKSDLIPICIEYFNKNGAVL